MSDEPRFPTDETTLTMLIAACKINPDSGHTELMSFLDMGTREKSRTEISDPDDPIPVYDVEFEEGYEPFGPEQVIETLAEELLQTRRLEEALREMREKLVAERAALRRRCEERRGGTDFLWADAKQGGLFHAIQLLDAAAPCLTRRTKT